MRAAIAVLSNIGEADPYFDQSIVKGPSLGLLSKHIVAGMRGGTGFLHPHLSISEMARIAIDGARNACVEGNAPLEIELLRRAIAAEPDLPSWVFTRLAQALFASGQNRAATEIYLIAIKRDPRPLTTHFRLREVLRRSKSSNIALHVLQLARQARIDSPAIARITGTLCLMLGDVAEAERCIRIGLGQVPESLELRLQLLELLLGHGRFAEAEEQLVMALAYPIENDVAYQILGMHALRLSRIDLATDCLQKSVAIDPGNASALALLGHIQATKGDIESARNLNSRVAKIQHDQKFRAE